MMECQLALFSSTTCIASKWASDFDIDPRSLGRRGIEAATAAARLYSK